MSDHDEDSFDLRSHPSLHGSGNLSRLIGEEDVFFVPRRGPLPEEIEEDVTPYHRSVGGKRESPIDSRTTGPYPKSLRRSGLRVLTNHHHDP